MSAIFDQFALRSIDGLHLASRNRDRQRRLLDQALSDLGLSFARWQVLDANKSVHGVGTTSQLARILGRSRQTVQRIANDLIRLGFITAAPNPADKRSQRLEMSPAGENVLAAADLRIERHFHDDDDPATSVSEDAGITVTVKTDEAAQDLAANAPDRHRRVRAFEVVQQAILTQIRNGDLTTGSKLPPERELAMLLGFGRAAVREALRSLEMAGVLQFRSGPKGGAFVRESASDGVTTSIRAMLILGRLPLTDLLEVRSSLLGQCARLGTSRGNDDDFARLDANIDELEYCILNVEDQVASIGPATEFYRLAARASHNPLMELLIESMADLVAEMLTALRHWPRVDAVSARREMVKAMRDGRDDDAECAIRNHSVQTNLVLNKYQEELMVFPRP